MDKISSVSSIKRHTKLTNVDTIHLSKWEELHQVAKTDWIYRGMKDSTLALETALERNGYIRDGIIKNLKRRERFLLREFQRRYYHYSTDVPASTDTLEWLSIMQNHGAPTRLLDWSYSIYVAAYFALEQAETDCAVWAINTKWIYGQLKKKFKNQDKQKFLTEPIRNTKKHRSLFKEIFITNKDNASFIAVFAPFRLNERLTIQKGTSVVPANLAIGFEENLSKMSQYDNGANLKKIVIPLTLRRIAIQSLFYMNISRATLFPGLDGFASSLGIYQPNLDEVASEPD